MPSIEEDQPWYIEEAQSASIEDPNAYNDDYLPSPLKNSDCFIGWRGSNRGRSPDSIKNPSPPHIDYSSVEAMITNFIKLTVFRYIGKHSKTLAFS